MCFSPLLQDTYFSSFWSVVLGFLTKSFYLTLGIPQDTLQPLTFFLYFSPQPLHSDVTTHVVFPNLHVKKKKKTTQIFISNLVLSATWLSDHLPKLTLSKTNLNHTSPSLQIQLFLISSQATANISLWPQSFQPGKVKLPPPSSYSLFRNVIFCSIITASAISLVQAQVFKSSFSLA